MSDESIELEYMPQLKEPLFIGGFDGWGNALDISRGMADYLIRKLDGKSFAKINPDLFYRFDENRPIVDIEDGVLRDISPPGGGFFAVERGVAGRDIIVFKATEPNLRWFQFADTILSICQELGVKTIITLGSMYDNVLHTEMIVSAVASSEELLTSLADKKVFTINYKGPGAVHSTIHSEARKRGFECVSFWSHCPYYLQGTTHYGLLSHLASLLSSWGGFDLDTEELQTTWRDLSKQIQEIIEKNPELQGMISDLRKEKMKGSWDSVRKQDKIIHLEDFFKQK